jgi:hypothetical protein
LIFPKILGGQKYQNFPPKKYRNARMTRSQFPIKVAFEIFFSWREIWIFWGQKYFEKSRMTKEKRRVENL